MRVARCALVPTLTLLPCLARLCCLASFFASLRSIAATLLFSLSLFPLYIMPHPQTLHKAMSPPRPARTLLLLSVMLVGWVDGSVGWERRAETTLHNTALGARRSALGARRSALGVGRWALGVGGSAFGALHTARAVPRRAVRCHAVLCSAALSP